MIGFLKQLLCWVKVIGATIVSAAIEVLNHVLLWAVTLVNALVNAWPIDMPTMPSMPSGLMTAYGWLAWSPLPLDALFGLVTFLIAVYVTILIAAPILRWLKVLA